MNHRFTTGLIVGGLMLLAAGCGDSRPFDKIGPAAALILYEGLPHQGYEHASLENERKTKKTFDLLGYPFYREPLELKADAASKLKTILGDGSSFWPFEGEKTCGGFHPDYAVEWIVDGKMHKCLICFGCREVKTDGPTGESRFNLRKDAAKSLGEILKPYRKNRPEFKPTQDGLSDVLDGQRRRGQDENLRISRTFSLNA